MNAWLLDSFDGVARLRRADVADPAVGTQQVLLKLAYAALNPADRYLAMGQYPAKPPLPHVLGRDGIGEIEAIGSGVDAWSIGQRVLVLRGEAGVSTPGTFAEKVAVDADSVVAVPQGWSVQESAGATLVYLTAYQALTQWADLRASATVLITGASGGVGVAATQLAHAMGHRVIALSRSATKRERLVQLGANLVVDPSDDASWKKTVRQWSGERRVDLAIDNIGGALLPHVIDCLGDGGRVSCVGRLAGEVPSFNTASLFFRRLKLGGVAVGSYGSEQGQRAWSEIIGILARTGAKPLVDSVFPFDKLAHAFARLEAGPMGKVLLETAAR